MAWPCDGERDNQLAYNDRVCGWIWVLKMLYWHRITQRFLYHGCPTIRPHSPLHEQQFPNDPISLPHHLHPEPLFIHEQTEIEWPELDHIFCLVFHYLQLYKLQTRFGPIPIQVWNQDTTWVDVVGDRLAGKRGHSTYWQVGSVS